MRTYFEGWYDGVYARATDWIRDNLVCVEIREYHKSTRVNSPDIEKVFLLRLDNPESVIKVQHTIVSYLSGRDEARDYKGHLIPINVTIPAVFR